MAVVRCAAACTLIPLLEPARLGGARLALSVAAPPSGDAISRAGFTAAGLLALTGFLRLAGDMLTDANPAWTDALRGTWLLHVVRTAGDGTLAGALNTQGFKLLAVPCAMGVCYFINLVVAGSLSEADRRWRAPANRALAVAGLLALCTFIEIEKATHRFGLGLAGLLDGERAWANHALHGAGALLGWWLSGRLCYARSPSPPSSVEGAG